MEALGSPSISRAPMGGSHAFLIRVYAGDRYHDNTLSFANLRSILLLQDFFRNIFDRLCVFVFVSFWSYFLCESTHYEKQKKKQKKKKKKKNIKITTIYKQVEQTHYCVEVFSDYYVKIA